MTSALNGVVRLTCDLEGYTVAVERVTEYADCPQEVGTMPSCMGLKPLEPHPCSIVNDTACVLFEIALKFEAAFVGDNCSQLFSAMVK